MKFTQIPTDTFQKLQLNAGILLSTFVPSTGTITADGILGATAGGVSFSATPNFIDLGEGVDNCPKNMKELKRIDGWAVLMSGTFLTIDTARVKSLFAAADIDAADTTKVTPRNDLSTEDFSTIWWVGDYSDMNGTANGGFIAIKMINALSTGGFKLQSADKGKGQAAFEYSAHYSMSAQDTVPCEVYVKAGTAEAA